MIAFIRCGLIVVSLFLIAACASEQVLVQSEQPNVVERQKPKIESVDEIDRAVIPDIAPVNVQAVTHTSVVQSYQKALALISDPAIRAKIERRLAGLAMVESEEMQVQGETVEQQRAALNKFDSTILSYKKFLKDYPDHPDNDIVYYQLAKAYGLKGDLETSDKLLAKLLALFPDSKLAAEANYRRAEYFYSSKKYHIAERAYKQVLKQGSESKFDKNARYMLAWSLFKQSEYELALDQFTVLLDELAPTKAVYDTLTKNQKALIEDSFRAMSYGFSYQEGGDSVVAHFNKHGKKHYESLVFSSLGLLYQSKERYQDAADTYLAYIKRHPLAEDGPDVYARVIKVYELGRFPSVIIPAKEEYATRYGIHSQWHQAQSSVPETHTLRLKSYISQLASYFHTRGQKAKKAPEKQKEYFGKAIVWYKTYIEDFPKEADVAQKFHRSGDVYVLLGETHKAAAVYLSAAYEYPDYDILARSSAGYSAVVAYQTIAEASQSEADQRAKITQSMRYASEFANDARSIGVLVDASESLLKLNDYEEARKTAQSVIVRLLESGKSEYSIDQDRSSLSWQPYSTRKHRRASWVVVGHASFELADYPKAEHAYTQALRLMGKKHKLYPSLRQRVAISIYRQGELFAKNNENQKALDEYSRVLVVIPEADIKVQTQYDITAQLLILKQWPEAIKKLSAFRKTYPKHELSGGIRGKLIYAYEESGRWADAANELTVLSNDEKENQDTRRKALYQSAEYYEKDGRVDKAIDRYRTYAHGYPDPFVVNLETQNKLAELYKAKGETNKRKFWLKKIIKNDRNAGSDRSARSQYLAASASFELAEDDWKRFTRAKLTLPLGKSIKVKQKAMQKVIKKYTSVADYGVAEYSTASTHRIAEAYYRMSQDLMDSQRPKGLNALELEQYDILLEEQAYPFEETSIEVYETNVARTKDGVYDQWVKDSFSKLAIILPARYAKEEQVEGYAEVIQ
ncbi:tetratricopeptide repeat protein [Litoribacillus peritrichatus]|uniref:Tetratricopeptide repeat protein n=1 Tax=Litoribacillus peritrichatus TaxID=718191 RepID=A0ABP7N5E4_9GAMM